MAGISRLDLPARKMFVNDLQNAVPCLSADSGFTDINYWRTESAGDTTFSIVWLQGNVSASEVGVVVHLTVLSTIVVQNYMRQRYFTFSCKLSRLPLQDMHLEQRFLL